MGLVVPIDLRLHDVLHHFKEYILEHMHVRDMGLYFSALFLLPFLKAGTTLAVFQSSRQQCEDSSENWRDCLP